MFDVALIKEATKVLSTARALLNKKTPYMMDAVYMLVPHPIKLPPQANGMAVTALGVLLYDPETITKKWKIEDVMTGLVHEADHILRKHHKRGIERSIASSEEHIWNVGTDAEINDDLAAMQLPLLDTDATPKKYKLPDGKLAEWYFDELKKQATSTTITCRGVCGSGAGSPLPDEDGLGAPVIADKQKREVHLEAMRESVAEAVMKHGSAPANLKRWANEFKNVKKKQIDWRTQLLASARLAVSWAKGNTHSTYAQPNRRQGGVGWGAGAPVLAGSHRPIAEIALVQDTSGSMGGAAFQSTIDQAGEILAASGGKVTFMSIDAMVHTKQKIKSANQIQALLQGGGGTDFRPAFTALKLLKPRPSIIVFATDGQGYYPEPSTVRWCKTIWLQCSPYRVPFGQVIPLPVR